MSACPNNVINTNDTSLSFAEESCPSSLPEPAELVNWYPVSVMSFSDMGFELKTVDVQTINPSNKKQKSLVVGGEAKAGFTAQFKSNEIMHRLLQGFMRSDFREKSTTKSLNVAQIKATDVSGQRYTFDNLLNGFQPGAMFLASGFSNAKNNGIKRVESGGNGSLSVTVTETLEAETPPADAKIEVCGFTFDESEVDIVESGFLVRLSFVSISPKEIATQFKMIPGEWIFLGGSDPLNRFNNNVGYARIGVITDTYIQFDKITWPNPVSEVGSGKSISVYFGHVLVDESDPDLIKNKTYQFERALGKDSRGPQGYYLTGLVADELSISMAMQDTVQIEMSFLGEGQTTYNGYAGPKVGLRPKNIESNSKPLNTSSDVIFMGLTKNDINRSYLTPYATYAEQLTIELKNSAQMNGAIGVLGSIATSKGLFEVSGSANMYFKEVQVYEDAKKSISASLHTIFYKSNSGFIFDIPELTVTPKEQAEISKGVMLDSEFSASESKNNSTMLYQHFPYLPDIASDPNNWV